MTMTTRAPFLRNRNWLLASAATLSLMIGGAAHAQSSAPVGSILSPQGSNLDPNVVIALPGTSTSSLDTTNITGVGQLVTDTQNGFIGLCTGTLINPRTVLFAAHCVNENPAGNGFQDPWGYGTGAGQLPIGIFFNANNNAAGNSAIGHWLNGVAGGPKDLTRINEYAYNINQVLYNSQSTLLGVGNNFLQADVALGVLDTPAANVPTWALLFSALPAPTSTNPVTGTGYHVEITGYGDNGTGNTGQGSIDFRRRIAENYIGLLGSLDDQDTFLFGGPDGLPQNLYMMDFDDPTRTNPFDFNIFPDDAAKHEGITAPGDSGGPLILDRAYAKKLVIAVLSGGDRFYGAQPGSSYGTTSFYQPLYLYWDYIAANNPYRYVSALAGDGNWTDPTHWKTDVDPAYNILLNGQLMTGVPTTPGTGIADTSPGFGSVCYYDVCEDITTGVVTVGGVPVNATEPATGSTGGVATGLSSNLSAQSAGAQAAAAALPAPTLANGLPGATNFVPNNISPNATTHTNARYFDVTLSAAGTTTLDTAAAVDRFTISGASSKLSVTSAGSLTSLINMNQYDGVVVNN
ncbi:MAG: autotransporter domain-containing protein, partial [Sphingomonas bacterium]